MKLSLFKTFGVPVSACTRVLCASAAFCLSAAAALAQSTNQIVFDLRTLIGGPATNRTVLITPMVAPSAVGPAIQIGDSVRFNSGSGTFVATNMNPGLYRVEVQPPPRLTWFALELTNVTGWATASWFIVESPVPETTYPRSVIDSRFDALGSIFTTYPAATNIAAFISSESISNAGPSLATNAAVAPDGYVLARTGNRLRLEERTTPAAVTNIASWLIVTSSLPNIIYVSASRGTLNGERNNPLKPFASISTANSVAQPGDTVMVLDGTFVEKLYTKQNVSYWFNRGVLLTFPLVAFEALINANHQGESQIAGFGRFATPQAGNGCFIRITNNASLIVSCESITNSSVLVLGYPSTNISVVLAARFIESAYVAMDVPAYSVVVKGGVLNNVDAGTAVPVVFDGVSLANWNFSDTTNKFIGASVGTRLMFGYSAQ